MHSQHFRLSQSGITCVFIVDNMENASDFINLGMNSEAENDDGSFVLSDSRWFFFLISESPIFLLDSLSHACEPRVSKRVLFAIPESQNVVIDTQEFFETSFNLL